MDTVQTPHHTRTPTRRTFLQSGLAAIATTLLIGIGSWVTLTPDISHAREIKIPGAIIAEDREFSGLADAWNYFHTGSSGSNNVPSHIYAANIMGLGPEEVKIRMNREKAEKYSFGYHLLAAQIEIKSPEISLNNVNWKKKNLAPSLYWYSRAAFYLYENKDKKARDFFAYGLFAGAGVTQQDFEKLKKQGVSLEWNNDVSPATNAEIFGWMFARKMNLTQKEYALNLIKDRKPNDPKGVYWNLGGYMKTELELGNKNIANRLDRFENKNSLYAALFDQFGYDTISNSLFNP
ncbi:MAG: hypothetical protein KUF72_03715 [Candidatus Thiodiazotropha sp. (ex Ctena orbiculata)]|nr:hypothetical protein [Candidatus Thiodiazotropha taylori]